MDTVSWFGPADVPEFADTSAADLAPTVLQHQTHSILENRVVPARRLGKNCGALEVEQNGDSGAGICICAISTGGRLMSLRPVNAAEIPGYVAFLETDEQAGPRRCSFRRRRISDSSPG